MAENIILLFALSTLTLAGLTSQQYSGVTSSCSGLQSKHEFSNFSVGQRFATDDSLSICVYNDSTCCTRDMEQLLHTLSGNYVRNILAAKTDIIYKVFSNGVTKFKDIFENYIDSSDRALDKEFMKRYKEVYTNNSHVTKSFYDKLREHYRKGEHKISDIVNNFFKEVLKEMYLLFRAGKVSRIKKNCIAFTYSKLTPFGKVPREIISRLERSFTAARTIIEGLETGKSVVERLSKGKWFSGKCSKSVTKMSQCSICAGYNNLKPCAGRCIEVLTECFASLTEVEQAWDEYISNLNSLATRLKGEYEFEAVMGELPYDISEGIENFQQALRTVLPKVDKYCKPDKVKKQTRSLITSDDDDFFLENSDRVGRNIDTSRSRQPRYNSIYSVIEGYKKHFAKIKMFWTKLPTSMCDETVVATNTSAYCWDGHKIVNNTKSGQQGKINQTIQNYIDDISIDLIIIDLKFIAQKMNDAANGKLVPTNKPDSSGSGSGVSGSASGDKIDDDEDTTTGNQIPIFWTSDPTKENPENNYNVNVLTAPNDVEPREIAGGGASYTHKSIFLLITSLLVLLLE